MNTINQTGVDKSIIQEGDLIQLVGPREKSFILTMVAGGEFHTHKGIIQHDDVIGKQWGSLVTSHNGTNFLMLQPALDDITRTVKRTTQIMYPKDIGYILVSMGISPGNHVVEAGTGSGAFTIALANAVGPSGHVTTYEQRHDTQNLAMKNIAKVGFSDRVTFLLRDISEGFTVTNADALFLDVPNPEDYMQFVREALKPGGFFGCILPTANQVIRLLSALKQENFAFVEVSDIARRSYKTNPSRFRPEDRMNAHTGFLIFARPMTIDVVSSKIVTPEKYEARMAQKAKEEAYEAAKAEIDKPIEE